MGFAEPIVIPENVEKPVFFSRRSQIVASRSGDLPHWEQSGATVFVTFRLADSIPQEKLNQWRGEEEEWERQHPQPWDDETQLLHDRTFAMAREEWLDRGYGECLLAKPQAYEIVKASLRHFDGKRYRLYSYVIMPNHVHLVFMPFGGRTVKELLHSWKSFTAHQINAALTREGKVWQDEYFDRYVRDVGHFGRVMRYVKHNDPKRAWTVGSW
jgi:type I restriction enzyme R subunit